MLSVFQDHVEYVFLAMAVSGIFFIIDDDIKLLVNKFELKRSLKMKQMNVRKTGSVSRHIAHMLDTLPGKKRRASEFIKVSVTLSAVVFIATAVCVGSPACFAAGSAVLAAPYIYLRSRYEKLISAAGEEREKLISLILSSYKMNNLNIEKAIEYAASQTADLPHTAPLLSKMLLRLRECSNENDVRDVTERFAEAAGGGWARTFAVNIRAAYIRGRDIHISLEEELKQISETKQLMQERMRSNNESVRMTFFMVPATLLITTVLAVRQMNMPLLQLIKAQFSNSTGCMLFMAILLLFIFNIVSTQIFLKKRTDL